MTPVRLKVEDHGGARLLIAEGELVTGEADQRLDRAFNELLGQGQKRVVLDLAGVTYIDSSVLGKIVHGHSMLRSSGGRLRLLHLPKRVRDLLEVTRLISVFEVFDDRQAALENWDSQGGLPVH